MHGDGGDSKGRDVVTSRDRKPSPDGSGFTDLRLDFILVSDMFVGFMGTHAVKTTSTLSVHFRVGVAIDPSSSL